MIIKDQPASLAEFLTHHYTHHGIRRFYIYDDASSPQLSSTHYPGIPSASLTFTYLPADFVPADSPERENLQLATYTRCVEDHGAKHAWLAFLDPDEFVEMRAPARHPTLLGWLKYWERLPISTGGQVAAGEENAGPEGMEMGALAIQWLGHTAHNRTTRPPAGMSTRQAFTECLAQHPTDSLGPNRHVKSFVRPTYFQGFWNIHCVQTVEGSVQVGEHGDVVSSFNRLPISHEMWGLHHYATKSREEFEEKRGRGRVQGQGAYVVDERYWEEWNGRGMEKYACPEMERYVP